MFIIILQSAGATKLLKFSTKNENMLLLQRGPMFDNHSIE